MSQELENVQDAAEQKEAELQKSLDQAQTEVRPQVLCKFKPGAKKCALLKITC